MTRWGRARERTVVAVVAGASEGVVSESKEVLKIRERQLANARKKGQVGETCPQADQQGFWTCPPTAIS